MAKRAYLAIAGVLAGLLASAPVLAASGGGQTMTMEATAYGPSAADNYPYGATDYFGQPLVSGDIAVDPSVIPLKTCLYVTGYRSPNLPSGGYIGEADDEGGAIKGMHVDLFMNTSQGQVNNFGIQHVKVTELGPPTNPSKSGTAACAGYNTSGGQSGATGKSNSGGSGNTAGTTGNSAGGNGGTSHGAANNSAGSTVTTTTTGTSAFDAAVVKKALAEVGRPYVWGGTTPAGFDCSGLVQWLFHGLGVDLPRLSGQQYRATTRISQSQLQPGDLVFFQTYKPGPSHVGIYIGAYNGIQHAFVAADNPRVGVEIDNLDTAKWQRLYYGAGRVTAPAATSTVGGQSSQGTTAGSSGNTSTGSTTGTTSGTSSVSAVDTAVVKLALAELGRPYVWGGTTPSGFDCSGLVQWVFAHNGVSLPRLSGQQYRATTRLTQAQLQPGDLVFFQTYKPGPSHVGIYIGAYNGIQHAFVAADNPRVGVEVDNLDTAKWQRLYYGAGRVTQAQ